MDLAGAKRGEVSCCAITFSPAVEDYLKTIHQLGSRGESTTMSALARAMGVSAPSSSTMLKRLFTAKLAQRDSARHVALTEHGQQHALRILRRHRLLETFLASVLDLPWDEVHAEAEVLEHALSERVERRIDELLGFPTHDPHGDPIPKPDGSHDEAWGTPLAEVAPGAHLTVERVSDRSSEALRYLDRCGIGLGVTIAVEERLPFGGPLKVRVGETLHVLSEQLTRMVYGTALDERSGTSELQ